MYKDISKNVPNFEKVSKAFNCFKMAVFYKLDTFGFRPCNLKFILVVLEIEWKNGE